MNCIFYDKTLKKSVPCILIPNTLWVEQNERYRVFFIQVKYDTSKFEEYSVTQQELNRYSSEFVKFHDLYPVNTQNQIDYANLVIPNLITNNEDELDRYEALISMITDVEGDITTENFYNLAGIISYELLFLRCTYEERMWLFSLSLQILVEQPPFVLVPQMIRMVKTLFTKYTNADICPFFNIDNYNNYSAHKNTLPIPLNIQIFRENCMFIDC
jgi:hypothetical protein